MNSHVTSPRRFLFSRSFLILFTFLGLFFSVNGQWVPAGNAAAVTDKLGTTNNISLRLYSNNLQRMIVDSTGKVGVGIGIPLNTFTIQSSGSVPLGSKWVSTGNPIFAGLGED